MGALYTVGAVSQHTRLDEIQGGASTYFCGAWQGFGFHEDGLRSASQVAARLGVEW